MKMPDGKTPFQFASTLKRQIILFATLLILFNLNTSCFAQKNRMTLGVGLGIGYAEIPTVLVFGEILYNVNPRLSAGLEVHSNNDGNLFADGNPFFTLNETLGFLAKAKYHFKDSGTRFFMSGMAGIYNVQYAIYTDIGSAVYDKVPNGNPWGGGLEAGVRFSRRFQLSVAYHQAQSFSVDVDYTDPEQGPGTFTNSYDVNYSAIQLKAGWFFGVF